MLFELTTPHLFIIEGSTEASPRPEASSGSAYTRTAYLLVECPPVAYGQRYILVGHGDGGRRSALGIGRALSGSETLNLAEIRHQAACLGATEVHVLART